MIKAKFTQRFLLFLIYYIPLEGFLLKFFPDELTNYLRYIPELFIYLLFLDVVLTKWLLFKTYYKTKIEKISILFFFFVIFTATFNGINYLYAMLEFRLLIRYFVLIFIVSNVTVSQNFIKKIVNATLGIAFIEALIGLSQSIFGHASYEFFAPGSFEMLGTSSAVTEQYLGIVHIRGTLTRYTNFGDFMCLLSLVIFSFRNYINKIKFKFIFPIIVLSIFLSATRSSIFMTISGIVLIFLLEGNLKKTYKIIYASLFLIFISSYIGSFVTDAENPLERLLDPFNSNFEYSQSQFHTGSRYLVLGYLPLQFIKTDRALVGFSPGSFKFGDRRKDILENKLNAHDRFYLHDVYWVQLLISFGIIGLAIWLSILYKILISLFKNMKNSTNKFERIIFRTSFILLISLIFFNFFGEYFEVRETSYYPWLFIGLSYSQLKNKFK